MTRRRTYCKSGVKRFGMCRYGDCSFCGRLDTYTVVYCDKCRKEIFDDIYVELEGDKHYHTECANKLTESGKEVI